MTIWRSQPDPKPCDGPRVLAVGHNRRHLGMLSRRLAEDGFRMATADSGPSAIAELHRAPVDLVLAELNMPGTSGADLARLIREDSLFHDLPVMLITGRSNPHNAVRAYAAGADDVILKPFHWEVLVARIQRRVDAAQRLRRLREDNAALDARVVQRALELGEAREQLAQLGAGQAR